MSQSTESQTPRSVCMRARACGPEGELVGGLAGFSGAIVGMPAGFRHRRTVDAVFARMPIVAVLACRRVLTPSTFLRKRSMQCKKAADRRSPTQRGFAGLVLWTDRSIDRFALLCFADFVRHLSLQ